MSDVREKDEGRRRHPLLPDIRDEAADTPFWVPIIGFAVLAAAAALLVYQAATGGPTEASEVAPTEQPESAGDAGGADEDNAEGAAAPAKAAPTKAAPTKAAPTKAAPAGH
jgi:hypothetical protein